MKTKDKKKWIRWVASACIFAASVSIYVLGINHNFVLNHYVLEFKGCPPMYNDFFAAKTATTVMGSYTYVIDKRIIYGAFLFLLVMTLLISFQYSKPEKPEGYSKVAAQRSLSLFEPEGTETMAMDQKPIIIAIMKFLRRTSRRGE